MAKPIVDGLEQKLDGKAEVVRLDVMSQVGRQAAARYGVRGMPTLLVVNGNGQAIYTQVGIVRPAQVIDQIETIFKSN